MSRVRRILHPTDFSPASNAAFARAPEMAWTNRAELVLGTHGRTGLARFFFGSVASRVVATATVPVLTVRGK